MTVTGSRKASAVPAAFTRAGVCVERILTVLCWLSRFRFGPARKRRAHVAGKGEIQINTGLPRDSV